MEDAVIFLMCFGDIAVILVGIFAVFTLSWSRGSGGCLCCSHCTCPPSPHLLRLIVYIYLPTPYLWKILACHRLLTGNWSQVKTSTYLFVSKLGSQLLTTCQVKKFSYLAKMFHWNASPKSCLLDLLVFMKLKKCFHTQVIPVSMKFPDKYSTEVLTNSKYFTPIK